MSACFTNKWWQGKMRRYYYYRCTCVNKKGWQACSTKEVSADRIEKYILENLERISLDKNYLENLVFKLNHSLKSSKPNLKNLEAPQQAGLEPSAVCSKFSVETIVSILKLFLSFLSQRRGVERNLLVKRFIKDIVYSPETIKITLFYSENLKDFQISQTKESPALFWHGRAKFSGRGKENFFPPQQREFVSNYSRARIKRFQTFSLILPNLIHKSKKLDLNR